MAVVCWIFGVLAGLIILIGLLRVGVRLTMHSGKTTVDVTVGPLHFRSFPKKEPSKAERIPPKAAPAKKEKIPKPSFSEIRELLKALWPPLKRALERTRRSIRIDPLQAAVTVGGEEDPAAAAQLYGELHGAVWTVMPVLEQLLVIRDPFVHIGIDFNARETKMEGTLGVSIRVGTVLRIAWIIGVPAMQWFLAFRKRHTATQPAQPAPAGDPVN